jgi:hypothetical protein
VKRKKCYKTPLERLLEELFAEIKQSLQEELARVLGPQTDIDNLQPDIDRLHRQWLEVRETFDDLFDGENHKKE